MLWLFFNNGIPLSKNMHEIDRKYYLFSFMITYPIILCNSITMINYTTTKKMNYTPNRDPLLFMCCTSDRISLPI